jgi:aminopeptidase N
VQDSAVLRDHVIEVGLYDDRGGVVRRRELLPVEISGAETLVPGARPSDLVLLNDRDLTFAKVRFDDRSLATLLTGLARVEDPLARALCWGALWDSARDGELAASLHVGAVLAGVVAEQDTSLVETLLGQALRAATSFAPPAEQDALTADIARACWAAAVDPGSDLQLVRVRAAVNATTDTARLQDLLTGTSVPEGLVIDSELRWHVVCRAAALGVLDEAAIERELAADQTASGQLQADAALASLPDPVAKQRSWDLLVGGAATNAQVRAIGGGFWQREQADLLRPYAAKSLEVLPGIWQTQSPMLARWITLNAFPASLVERDVLDRFDAFLSREDLHAGLRRVVIELVDDLRRSLGAQQSAPR